MTKFVFSAALLLSIRVAAAQQNACELSMHGKVQEMTSTTRDSSGAVLSEEKDEFDAQGRVLKRTIHKSAGSTAAIECGYESGRLMRAVTKTTDHSQNRTTEFRYSPEGLLLEADEKNADGVLIARTLSDPLRERPPALERTFRVHVSGPIEFDDRTTIDDENENASVTQLVVDGKEQASWRIERDSRGRVLRDEVAYSDLSFSQREFRQDGSSFEHDFDAKSGIHSYFWRDSQSNPLKEKRSGLNHDPSFSRCGAGCDSRPVRSRKLTVAYRYHEDQNGNWTERTELQGGKITAETSRTIQYQQ